jgi:hypothetical protein
VGEFAAGTSIGFTIRRAVRAWDGSTFGNASEERISMTLGPLGPVISPVDESPALGFATSVASTGEFHRHYGYTLRSPARDGVYLLELELWSLDGSLATSLPFWIVFGQNAEHVDVDAAAAWAQANLADACIADFNSDGFLDFNDFDSFVGAFEGGAAVADVTGDGFLKFDDFDAFVLALEAGC